MPSNIQLKIQTVGTVDGDAPRGHEFVSYIWLSAGKRWDRYGVCFDASTVEESRGKAERHWADLMAKIESNRLRQTMGKAGLGRRYEFPNAPDLFEALVAFNLSVERNDAARLVDADCLDLRGGRLRDMSEVVTYRIEFDDPVTDEREEQILLVTVKYNPVYRSASQQAKEFALALAGTLKEVVIEELGRDWLSDVEAVDHELPGGAIWLK